MILFLVCLSFSLSLSTESLIPQFIREIATKNPQFAFEQAVQINSLPSIYWLKDPDVDPSKLNNFPIRYAASKGFAAQVSIYLNDKRVDPSALGNYALLQAASNSYFRIVEMLMKDDRVDPSASHNQALNDAVLNQDKHTVLTLFRDDRVRYGNIPRRIHRLLKTLLGSQAYAILFI
jgi:hypothetical protein